MAEGIVYDQSVEMLVRVFGTRITPGVKDELRAKANIDFDAKLKPTYPADAMFSAHDILRRGLYPTLSEAEGFKTLGAEALDGFFKHTLTGKALGAVLRLLGPDRAMRRAPANFASGGNYQSAEVKQLAKGRWELKVTHVGVHIAMLEAMTSKGIEYSGAKNPRVEVLEYQHPAATFLVSWDV